MSVTSAMSRLLIVSRLPPTVEQVRGEFAALGDEPGDDALDLFAAGMVTCWATGPRPVLLAPRDEWLKWWRACGFVAAGLRMPQRRPSRSLRLYRAASKAHRRGMSWTPDRDYAELYADEHRAIGERSHVWQLAAEPSWLLGYLTNPRGTEYVVAVPEDAEIRRVEAPTSRTVSSTIEPMRQTWDASAAGVIVRDGDRVLLQLRSPRVQYGGTWSIPGGGVERGETPLDAALRELREESGLRRRDLRLTDRVHVTEPVAGWHYTTIVAKLRKRARPLGTPPPSAEATRHAWVQLADVETLPLHPGFAASWPEVRLLMYRPFRVVFVCQGNICRSPTAELLLRRMATDASVPVEVASRGVRVGFGGVAPGDGMDPGSAAVATARGLDPSQHRARQFTARDAIGADLVVALDQDVRRLIGLIVPGYAPATHPVVNPWRGSPALYEAAYRQIERACRDVLEVARAQPSVQRTARRPA